MILIIPDPSDINGQLCQKVMTSFDFVLPFAFENEHRFENFFSFIMESIGSL